MLFFKGKYNEKTFKENNDTFKNRIEELHRKTLEIRGAGNSDIGRTLSKMARLPEKYGYRSDFKAEDIKGVDDRILHILDLMENDVRDENISALSSHAEILFSAFKDARQYGKEKFSSGYLKNDEYRAEALGEMQNSLKEKRELQEAINEIKARARAARDRGDMVELQEIDLEFQQKNADMKACDENIQDWKRRYDDVLISLAEENFEKRLDKLEVADLESPEKLAQRVSKNTERLQQMVDKEVARKEIITEATSERGNLRSSATSSDSSVADVINGEDAAKIIDSSVSGGSQKADNASSGYTPSAGLFD